MSPTGADRILDRIGQLAALTDVPGQITRLPLGAAQARAAALIAGWMREAGMLARLDAGGNVIGDYPGRTADAPVLCLGSHYDTVRNAGAFDGTFGVVTSIEVVAGLQGDRLPFALRVLAFDDEEGVLFGTSELGSKVYCRPADAAISARAAEALRNAGRDPAALVSARCTDPPAAYLELHIEQGPVLDAGSTRLAAVGSIAGQYRVSVTMDGEAGHAGTVPMDRRRDALAGAAEGVLAVERSASARSGCVATVGTLQIEPAASNVIPGRVTFSIDLRSGDAAALESLFLDIGAQLRGIATRRGLALSIVPLKLTRPTTCAPWLVEQVRRGIGNDAPIMASGAGHDAVAMAGLAPVAMMFVACRAGVSHNPAEHVSHCDTVSALAAFDRVVRGLSLPPR